MPFPYKYFPLYAADFDTATRAMSATAVGIYIRLLISQWINGSIPASHEQLDRISGVMNLQQFEVYWAEIEHKFQKAGKGKLANRRLEVERKKVLKMSEQNRSAALARWKKNREDSELDADALQTLSESESESESESYKREDKNSAAGAAPKDLAGPVPKRKAHRIPENWEPDSKLLVWAADKVPHIDPRYETEKFRDYWMAVSGQRACKLDWRATWRNWMRTAGERGGQKQGNRARGGAGERVRQATGLDE